MDFRVLKAIRLDEMSQGVNREGRLDPGHPTLRAREMRRNQQGDAERAGELERTSGEREVPKPSEGRVSRGERIATSKVLIGQVKWGLRNCPLGLGTWRLLVTLLRAVYQDTVYMKKKTENE